MGKFIICNGKQADRPFYFKMTDTYVYSIEELCYYIYNNIDAMSGDLFGNALAVWMKEELDLAERAEKLQELIAMEAGLKDIIVCLLCSADYYSETEMKQLLNTMDELGKLTPFEKKKKKADNYLKYRQFTEAAMEYENILNSQEAVGLDSIQYGNLIHNLALAQLNTIGITAAADGFREAYERNHNIESLKQYLYTLIISRQEEKLRREFLNYGVDQELQEQLQSELESCYEEAEASADYEVIGHLLECKDSGRIVQFYQIAGDLINQWKQELRRENP